MMIKCMRVAAQCTVGSNENVLPVYGKCGCGCGDHFRPKVSHTQSNSQNYLHEAVLSLDGRPST